MTRFETLFSIRYAVRVLERTRRFWGRADTLIKVCALMAGSSAIYCLSASQQTATTVLGLLFAFTQALEFGLRPAEKSASARAEMLRYAALFAAQADHDDTALERLYHAICAADEVSCMESLRRIAYNDVVEERSETPEAAYKLTLWQRFMSLLA